MLARQDTNGVVKLLTAALVTVAAKILPRLHGKVDIGQTYKRFEELQARWNELGRPQFRVFNPHTHLPVDAQADDITKHFINFTVQALSGIVMKSLSTGVPEASGDKLKLLLAKYINSCWNTVLQGDDDYLENILIRRIPIAPALVGQKIRIVF